MPTLCAAEPYKQLLSCGEENPLRQPVSCSNCGKSRKPREAFLPSTSSDHFSSSPLGPVHDAEPGAGLRTADHADVMVPAESSASEVSGEEVVAGAAAGAAAAAAGAAGAAAAGMARWAASASLVSVDCLGCRVGVRVEAGAEGICSALERSAGCGGARIVRACVSEELFEGDAMQASTEHPLQEMLVRHLQAELAARSVGIRGNKGLLQLRLHGLVVAEAAQAARKEWEAAGGKAVGGEAGAGSSDESDEDLPLAARARRATAGL